MGRHSLFPMLLPIHTKASKIGYQDWVLPKLSRLGSFIASLETATDV